MAPPTRKETVSSSQTGTSVGNRARAGTTQSSSGNSGQTGQQGKPKGQTSVRDIAGLLAQTGRGIFQQATGGGRSAPTSKRQAPKLGPAGGGRANRVETVTPQYLAQMAARRQQGQPGNRGQQGGFDPGGILYDDSAWQQSDSRANGGGGIFGDTSGGYGAGDMSQQMDPMLMQMLQQQYQQPQFWSQNSIQQRGMGF